MDDNIAKSEELVELLKRVKNLEEELEKARMAAAKAYFANLPLPYTDEELVQIVEEERGLPLEDFLAELEKAAGE